MNIKTVFISGAERGLGAALTELFLRNGHTVLAGYYHHNYNFFQSLSETYNKRIIYFPLDISCTASVKQASAICQDYVTKIDIIINNASILGKVDQSIPEEIDYENILEVININAVGALRITNSLYSLLNKSVRFIIVNITSEAGSISSCSRKSWFGYSMAKAALNMETRILHNSLSEQGGTVLAIHPGGMQTPMRRSFDPPGEITPQESAEGIYQILEYHFSDKKNIDPAYNLQCIDYKGNVIPW